MKQSEPMDPLMNNTKWEEIRLAMYALGNDCPRFRIRDLSGNVTRWDGEWYYHFCLGGYKTIEWVEIQFTTPKQEEEVHSRLKAIHVPGRRIESGFRVYGYAPPGEAMDYIK